MRSLQSPTRRIHLGCLVLLAVIALVGALLPSAVSASSADLTIESAMESRGYNNGYRQPYRNNNSRQTYYQQPQKYYGGNYQSNHGQMYYGGNNQNQYHYNNQYQSGHQYGYTKQYDSCAQRYVVHRGDTLSRIARRYGTTVNALSQANGIYNPHRIYAGERLCVPYGYGYGYHGR